jgi:hypothetical protein
VSPLKGLGLFAAGTQRFAAGVGECNLSRLSRHLYSVDSRHLDSVERRESFNCIRWKRRESLNRDRMNGGFGAGGKGTEHFCQVPQWYRLSARDWLDGRYIGGLPVIFTPYELVFWK